jgi:hypothetical protein
MKKAVSRTDLVSLAFEHAKRQLFQALRLQSGRCRQRFANSLDADPDIPFLIQAKAEYVKLK